MQHRSGDSDALQQPALSLATNRSRSAMPSKASWKEGELTVKPTGKSGETPTFDSHSHLLDSICPPTSEITVCELRCDLITSKIPCHETPDDFVKGLPEIRLRRGHTTKDGALRCIGVDVPSAGDNREESSLIVKMQDLGYEVLKLCQKFLGVSIISPGLSVPDSLAWSQDRDNNECPIHAYAGHPGLQKFAVARFDSAVEIYTSSNTSHDILIHELQSDVTDLAWCPTTTNRLAVACSAGVILWETTEPAVARLYPGPAVGTISWSPQGDLLAVGALKSNVVRIWDIARSQYSELIRPGDTLRLLWSPDGLRLLQTTTTAIFRVWETCTWTCETWQTPAETCCQTACWGSSGQVLLLSTSKESVIYSLQFQDSQKSVLFPIFDTESVTITTSDGSPVSLGGPIEDMAWDGTNERLAVSFAKDGSSHCPLVAMFRTHLRYPSAHPEIILSGFVRGESNLYPYRIDFLSRSSFVNASRSMGAILSICWAARLESLKTTSERKCSFSFLPMYFSSEYSRKSGT